MANELLFYHTPDGEQRIEVVFRDENFWMTQKALADLFAVGTPAINKHLANIYESGELTEAGTLSKMEIVGRSRPPRTPHHPDLRSRDRQDRRPPVAAARRLHRLTARLPSPSRKLSRTRFARRPP